MRELAVSWATARIQGEKGRAGRGRAAGARGRRGATLAAAMVVAVLFMPASVALAANQIIVSGANQALGTGSPKSNVFMGPQAWFTHPPNERLAVIPDAGTVSALRVVLTASPGNPPAKSYTFTIRKDTGGGPVATALTCTISGTSTSCSDNTTASR